MKSKDKLELMCLNSASYVLKEVELAGREKILAVLNSCRWFIKSIFSSCLKMVSSMFSL